MRNIESMRKQYTYNSISIKEIDSNPLVEFEKWFDFATEKGIEEPNSMVLSTVSRLGRPSSRVVLLKGLIESQFIFYTNYKSKKAKDILYNSFVALNFFWSSLERQIRIEGNASKVSEEMSDSYFKNRPLESRISACVSKQSSTINNKDSLEKSILDFNRENKNLKKIPRPNYWGGYKVKPYVIEFWQGRKNRLHDRVKYSLHGKNWKYELLAP